MLGELLRILAAAIITWLLFVSVDIFFRLPEKGGVSGASAVARDIQAAGGDIAGGTMMGNIVSSPDASAGTLLAACGVYVAGIPGGLIAAALVFIGTGQAVVELALSIASFTYGSFLGLFLLAARGRTSRRAAAAGFLAGVFVMVFVVFGTPLAWPLYTLVGSLATLLVALAVDRLRPERPAVGEAGA